MSIFIPLCVNNLSAANEYSDSGTVDITNLGLEAKPLLDAALNPVRLLHQPPCMLTIQTSDDFFNAAELEQLYLQPIAHGQLLYHIRLGTTQHRLNSQGVTSSRPATEGAGTDTSAYS
tara:strand:- start:5921 stop:6274 length:354 start_codon:yes stop_codon:yes gene_type:complete